MRKIGVIGRDNYYRIIRILFQVLGEMLEGLEREGQKLKQAKQSHQETLHHAQRMFTVNFSL